MLITRIHGNSSDNRLEKRDGWIERLESVISSWSAINKGMVEQRRRGKETLAKGNKWHRWQERGKDKSKRWRQRSPRT